MGDDADNGPYHRAVTVLHRVAASGELDEADVAALRALIDLATASTDPGMHVQAARVDDLLVARGAPPDRMAWLARKCLAPDVGPGAFWKNPADEPMPPGSMPSVVAMAVGGSEVDRYRATDVPDGYHVLRTIVARAYRRYGGLLAVVVVAAQGEVIAGCGDPEHLSPDALSGDADVVARLSKGETITVERGDVSVCMRLAGGPCLVVVIAKRSARVGAMRALLDVASRARPMGLPTFTADRLRMLFGADA